MDESNRNLNRMTMTYCYLFLLKKSNNSEIFFKKIILFSLCMISWPLGL